MHDECSWAGSTSAADKPRSQMRSSWIQPWKVWQLDRGDMAPPGQLSVTPDPRVRYGRPARSQICSSSRISGGPCISPAALQAMSNLCDPFAHFMLIVRKRRRERMEGGGGGGGGEGEASMSIQPAMAHEERSVSSVRGLETSDTCE